MFAVSIGEIVRHASLNASPSFREKNETKQNNARFDSSHLFQFLISSGSDHETSRFRQIVKRPEWNYMDWSKLDL